MGKGKTLIIKGADFSSVAINTVTPPTPTTATITVTTNNAAYGSVTGGGSYNIGASITISATANSGYRFVRWSDGNTSASRTITVSQSATYQAIFEAVSPSVTYPYTLQDSDIVSRFDNLILVNSDTNFVSGNGTQALLIDVSAHRGKHITITPTNQYGALCRLAMLASVVFENDLPKSYVFANGWSQRVETIDPSWEGDIPNNAQYLYIVVKSYDNSITYTAVISDDSSEPEEVITYPYELGSNDEEGRYTNIILSASSNEMITGEGTEAVFYDIAKFVGKTISVVAENGARIAMLNDIVLENDVPTSVVFATGWTKRIEDGNGFSQVIPTGCKYFYILKKSYSYPINSTVTITES